MTMENMKVPLRILLVVVLCLAIVVQLNSSWQQCVHMHVTSFEKTTVDILKENNNANGSSNTPNTSVLNDINDSESISCRQVQRNTLSGKKGWKDPVNGDVNLIRRVIDPPHFFISVHPDAYDATRYKSIYKNGRYYEDTVVRRFRTILQNKPPGIVLDVGMNIGYYTLLSASLGHSLVSFEINPANIMRACESLTMNGWADTGRVSLYQRGVSNLNDVKLQFVVPHNPGKAHVVTNNQKGDDASGMVTTTLTLDTVAERHGLLKENDDAPEIYLLKMDVEGHEPYVIQGATQLLQSGKVQNVLTEVKEMGREQWQDALSLLLDANYVLMDDEAGQPLTRSETVQVLQTLTKTTRRAKLFGRFGSPFGGRLSFETTQDLWFTRQSK